MEREALPKNVNFRIDESDFKKLHKIAANLGINVSILLRMLVKKRIQDVEDNNWKVDNFIK